LSIGGQVGNLFKDPNVQKKMDSWFGSSDPTDPYASGGMKANDKKGEQ
jgi:hypothetical protein